MKSSNKSKGQLLSANYVDLNMTERRLRAFIESNPHMTLRKAKEYLEFMKETLFNPEIAYEVLCYSTENSLEDEDLLMKCCHKFRNNIPFIMQECEIPETDEDIRSTISDVIEYFFRWLLLDEYVIKTETFDQYSEDDPNVFWDSYKRHPYLISSKGLSLLYLKLEEAIAKLKSSSIYIASRSHSYIRNKGSRSNNYVGRLCPYCDERPCHCSDRFN